MRSAEVDRAVPLSASRTDSSRGELEVKLGGEAAFFGIALGEVDPPTIAPPQLEPAPAVQPKRWSPVMGGTILAVACC